MTEPPLHTPSLDSTLLPSSRRTAARSARPKPARTAGPLGFGMYPRGPAPIPVFQSGGL